MCGMSIFFFGIIKLVKEQSKNTRDYIELIFLSPTQSNNLDHKRFNTQLLDYYRPTTKGRATL